MLDFPGRGILLDIEGTTSSVSFVYDVMFPFVRRELDNYLRGKWETEEVASACQRIAQDAGYSSLDAWSRTADASGSRELIRAEVLRLMDSDVKATGLKQLQGLIWKSGFDSGELRAHVYEDVPVALGRWHASGLDVRIYSSGSVAAQQLFFGHTTVGDLLPLLRGHYDTTTGPKKEADSYRAIAADIGLPGDEILFLSDVPDELDAAREAGLRTGLTIRPGNAEVSLEREHPRITSFDEIRAVRA